MSYQVLARKWRPHNFQAMVGQEHVLQILVNALNNQRLHHAYLFTGTRGVGKTTLARILAKCLNCEAGMSATPCDQCNACQSIDAGRFLDLIEVDAASRTKVEDTREILDNVQYAPSQGRYKIYLIDEVHMLSGHSFNALLKTLEEPPAHVKFLLATTDPKRLPITILSRCLQFNLKRVPLEQIAQHLQYICAEEKISYEDEALNLVANAADGSLRDGLSLLDQTIAYCNNAITTKATRQMLGCIEQDSLFRCLDALIEKDGHKLLAEIASLAEHAPDFNQALNDFLTILHQISLAQVIPDLASSSTQIQHFRTRLSAEDVQLYYQIALMGRRDLPLAPFPAQGFEMTMLRMLAFQPTAVTAPPKAVSTPPKKEMAPIILQAPVQTPTPIPDPTPALTTSAISWADILPNLELTGLAYTLASNCTLKKVDTSQIMLELAAKHEAIFNKKLTERIQDALTRHFNRPIKLNITVTTINELDTPAKQHENSQAARQANAHQAITNDDQIQKVLGMFNATIDINSIKAIDS